MNPLIADARRLHLLSQGGLGEGVSGCQRPISRGISFVYLLRLESGGLYIGASLDLEQRLRDHGSGEAGRTTRTDRPVALLKIEAFPSFSAARAREAQLKRWSRAKKEALIRGDFEALRALSHSTRGPSTACSWPSA